MNTDVLIFPYFSLSVVTIYHKLEHGLNPQKTPQMRYLVSCVSCKLGISPLNSPKPCGHLACCRALYKSSRCLRLHPQTAHIRPLGWWKTNEKKKSTVSTRWPKRLQILLQVTLDFEDPWKCCGRAATRCPSVQSDSSQSPQQPHMTDDAFHCQCMDLCFGASDKTCFRRRCAFDYHDIFYQRVQVNWKCKERRSLTELSCCTSMTRTMIHLWTERGRTSERQCWQIYRPDWNASMRRFCFAWM